MKVEQMIEWLGGLPGDYGLNLSQYSYFEGKADGDGMYFIRLDKPVVGWLRDDKNKEVCFLLTGEDVAKENGEHVQKIEKVDKDKIDD